MIFYHIGWNLLGSVTCNYGLNYAAAGGVTWGFAAGGLDWGWYKTVYGSQGLAAYGMTANVIGYGMPAALPLINYGAGLITHDRKLQTLGLALAQSTLLSTSANVLLKAITGRRQAGVYDLDLEQRDYSADFSFGFFNRGFIDGWPSGHAMNAVAAALTITEIYNDNIWLKIGAYTYAAALGLGMTFCDHWASDVIAGALIGYAIGKTVGSSFSRLVNNAPNENISLYILPNTVGIRLTL
jgi:membrane-associated phospholipid phosphatase